MYTLSTVEFLERRTLFTAIADDPSFNQGKSYITTSFGGQSEVANAVVVQKDGKIIAAGETSLPRTNAPGNRSLPALVRYNLDGSLDDGNGADTTPADHFGTNGKVILFANSVINGANVLTLALAPDGKIVVAGYFDGFNYDLGETPERFGLVVRLNSDGSFDNSFGDHGVVTSSFGTVQDVEIHSITLLPDGRIVAVGRRSNDWLISRYTTSGALDPTFSTDGYDVLDWGGIDVANSVAIDNLGNAVVTGDIAGVPGGGSDIGLARYLPTGVLDSNFSADGKVSYYGDSLRERHANSVVIYPGGYISVSGGIKRLPVNPNYVEGLPTRYSFTPNGDFLRYDERESGVFSHADVISAAVLQADQVAVYAEDLRFFYQGIENFTLVSISRGLNTLDDIEINEGDFGLAAGKSHTGVTSMTLAPDGKIVFAGYSYTGDATTATFMVYRLAGEPTAQWGSISGKVFHDDDGDGVVDTNEKPFANVRVYVDSNNNGTFDGGERDVLTDTSGNYVLKGLLPGTYKLRQTVFTGFSGTLPFGDGSRTVTVVAQKTIPSNNFGQMYNFGGNINLTRIVGNVFNDRDIDGKRDLQNPLEPDLPGRTVWLDLNKNGKIDTGEPKTTTDASGNYAFSPVNAGVSYRVRDVLPAGWYHTNPTSGFVDVTLKVGEKRVVPFATAVVDPDNTITKIANLAANTKSVGQFGDFTLEPANDVDLIKFTVAANQKVGFDVDSRNGSSLNTFLRVFNSGGTELTHNDDGNATGESLSKFSYVEYTFRTAGTYYVGVSLAPNSGYSILSGNYSVPGAVMGDYRLTLLNLGTIAAPTILRVNAGGNAYTTSTGQLYDADSGFTGGSATTALYSVDNTTDDYLYYTNRTGTQFSYSRSIVNGTYTLKLDFADATSTSMGQRRFDVFAEGKQILNDLDIYASAGGAKKAFSTSFTVIINDGKIDLRFAGVLGNALISSFSLVKV